MYEVLLTQHDIDDDVIGIDAWETDKLPDPQELGDKAFSEFGDCATVVVSVSVIGRCSPLYVIVVEGKHVNGEQN